MKDEKQKPKKYKYNIYVNQFAIIEHDLQIDFIEAAIFGMLETFAHQKGCNKMMDLGLVWYKFKWGIIPAQLPTLGIKGRTACYNRMKSLCGAKMLIAHEGNQKNRSSWYAFGESAELYNAVHQREHTVHQNEQEVKKDVHQNEHSVREGKQSSVRQSEHDNYTNNNYTNNNINIPSPILIEGLEIDLPENWNPEVKSAIIEYFQYRAALPKKDRLKTQFGVNKKIKAFSNVLKKHTAQILIKAIDLTISSEWKDVNIDWLFNKHPELRPKQIEKDLPEGENEQKAKTMFDLFCKHYRQIYEKRYIAKMSYNMAMAKVKFDIENLQPLVNDTYTSIMINLKSISPNLYSKAYNDYKKL